MTLTELLYMNQQFIKVAPLPIVGGLNGQFKVQLSSDKGKTNYINITPSQFRAIELLLCTDNS